jgi:Rrf2 family protein
MLSPMIGYAASALGYIALCDAQPVQVREVAKLMQIPAPYLAKIVCQLRRKRFVETRRGIGGGVRLAIDPAQTTLYDLCEALEDPILEVQCLLGLGVCNDDVACPAHVFSRDLRRRKLEFLRKTTLLDVGRYDQRRRKGSRKRKS